ncbi:MAG: hypothetical protein WKF30_06360 [Pyrinomonadaceae bacterium]
MPRPIERGSGHGETIKLANGKQFELNVHSGYKINVAAEGLKRARFMALSPDNRLFVTDMHNRTDNRRGIVYVLDEFNQQTKRFEKITKKSITMRISS